MKKTSILPMAFLAVALAGGSTLIATAQEAAQLDTIQTNAKPTAMKADFRGKHHGRRGGFGGEIFTNLFGQIDADNDGSVTQEELDAFRAAKVGEADSSGDGALSIEEFDTLYREFTRSRMVDVFQDLDADGDGVISGAEMDNRFGNAVERMDRDGDGALTLQRGRRG